MLLPAAVLRRLPLPIWARKPWSFPVQYMETGDAGHHDCHVCLYLYPKRFGTNGAHRKLTRRETLWGLFFGALIGFTTGFSGRGRAAFWLSFVRFLRLRFLTANASGKVINSTTNLAALTFFIPQGHVVWAWAIPLALAEFVRRRGRRKLAIRGGTQFLRYGFMVLLCLTIGKFAWDLIR